MGFTDPELFEIDQQIIEPLLAQAKPGLDFELWPLPVQFMCRQPPPYSSPTTDTRHQVAKIEIAGERYVAAGLPSAPEPLAEGRPPQDSSGCFLQLQNG